MGTRKQPAARLSTGFAVREEASQPVVPATVEAAAGRPSASATAPARTATAREPSPRSISTAAVLMPIALAAAMPSTPNGPVNTSPAPTVTSRPTPIARSGYQVGVPVEKYGLHRAPTRVWPRRPSA